MTVLNPSILALAKTRWPQISDSTRVVYTTKNHMRFVDQSKPIKEWPIAIIEQVVDIPGVSGLGYCAENDTLVIRP